MVKKTEEILWGLVAIAKLIQKSGRARNSNREVKETLPRAPIPLVSVQVKAKVVHSMAKVQVDQIYVNREENPIETIYYFPINPDGAVTDFRVELDGKVIKGQVKAQEAAKKDYDDAIGRKRTAALGEETKADIFKVRVGYLKPGVQAKVTIKYVTEVKNEPGSGSIRFYIPTTVAPRYVSPSDSGKKADEVRAMTFSNSSPAPLTLKVDVSLQGKIKSIECPSHPIGLEKAENLMVWDRRTVELVGQISDMDRDFVLIITPEEDLNKPRLYSERLEDGSTAMMLQMTAGFELQEQKAEIIFLLDRSGSMMGRSIELAKQALITFLHSLPEDCYFNVIGFGSKFKRLFPQSVKYDKSTLNQAMAHADTLDADLGGTEILQPLTDIYEKASIDGYLRQIFLITDGQVFNTNQVIGLARANAHKSRVFALGIGSGASHDLVEGIAKAGGGTAAFVTSNRRFEEKVVHQLKNGLQPTLTDIEIEWEGVEVAPPTADEPVVVPPKKRKNSRGDAVVPSGGSSGSSCSPNMIRQSPKKIPPIHNGCQLLIFGLFKDQIPKAVNLKAVSPDGPVNMRVEYLPDENLETSRSLHRLAAIKLIRELELDLDALEFQRSHDRIEKERLKNEIIEIGVRHGISSRFTSFVAVEENASSEKSSSEEYWVMESRNVPSQLTDGWHGISGSLYGGAAVRRACCAAKSCSKRASSSTTSSGKTSHVPLHIKLIKLQSFDGSYVMSKELCGLLGVTAPAMKKAAVQNNLNEVTLVTALAIVYFETKLAKEKAAWELVVTKAQKWIEARVSAGQIDHVFRTATSLL